MNKLTAMSPTKLLSPKSRKKLQKEIINLKNKEENNDDKKYVDDGIIRSYLIKNNMRVSQLRDVIHTIQQTWRQVTALILFRSVVIKAKRITDVMLNKHQQTQMIEYKHCLKNYQRVCKQLIAVNKEKEDAVDKIDKDTICKIETETANFDTELNAITIEYKDKLKELTQDINTKCNHPDLMQKWLRNEEIDQEYKIANGHETEPSIVMDLKLFDKYLNIIYKLADEYKEEITRVTEWRKRSEDILISRMQSKINSIKENKDTEIKFLEHEKNKWDKKYRVMRNITGYYRNCWLHYLASDDKVERQQIEDEMSNKEILYKIYQNILERYDAEEEMAKEKLIQSKYKDSPVKNNKIAFNYRSPKNKVMMKSDGSQATISLDPNGFRGTDVIKKLKQHKTQRISSTDIQLPTKLRKYVRGNSFIANINDLAAFSQFEIELEEDVSEEQ